MIVRAGDFGSVPWRNGAGRTHELATERTPDDFAWRVSLADLDRPAPFSAFPGVHRIFVVVTGTVDLRIDGVTSRLDRLDRIEFDGTAEVFGTPIDGSAQALNVMTTSVRASVRIAASADADCDLAVVLDESTVALIRFTP